MHVCACVHVCPRGSGYIHPACSILLPHICHDDQRVTQDKLSGTCTDITKKLGFPLLQVLASLQVGFLMPHRACRGAGGGGFGKQTCGSIDRYFLGVSKGGGGGGEFKIVPIFQGV